MNKIKFQLKRNKVEDPRIAISRQIGWTRPSTSDTEFSIPEPDDYNYAIYGDKPIECNVIKDQVFYKKIPENKWWSIYFVPVENKIDFLLWLEQQDFDIYWTSHKISTPRNRRHILYSRKNNPELTDQERLYAMGYYTKLADKYFSEDDTMLLERLGPARAEIFNGLSDG